MAMKAILEEFGSKQEYGSQKAYQLGYAKGVRDADKVLKKAFLQEYTGAGEVFFPYESSGNCTEEEAKEFAESEWKNISNTNIQALLNKK